MLAMHLPGLVYKRLPLIYVAAGSVSIWAFDANGPSVFSAGLLFAAALLTAYWRHECRWRCVQPTVSQRKERKRSNPTERPVRRHGPVHNLSPVYGNEPHSVRGRPTFRQRV